MEKKTEEGSLLADRPHVLIVDDDARICQLVSRYLTERGFVAASAASAAEARDILKNFIFDVLVVDVMMPGESGLEFTKSLRKEGDMPVLLLTALGEADDRIAGLESGADDYLSKPFEPRELVLRLEAILRRSRKNAESAKGLRLGRWIFDPEMEELSNGTETLRLTGVEANLLKALAGRPGEVFSRVELAALLGLGKAGERTIDVQVTRLRRKIEEDTKMPRVLQTVRGKGYLLRVEAL